MVTKSGERLPAVRLYGSTVFFERRNIMWNMIWPILVVVGANTVYNIAAKSTPNEVNSFASLSVSYVVAAVFAVVIFFITSEQKSILTELSKTNWTAYALGIAIVGLEFGFLCIYRAGWKVSTANLFASITLACVLLIVGMLLYKEAISGRQLAGMAVCAVGLVLIAK